MVQYEFLILDKFIFQEIRRIQPHHHRHRDHDDDHDAIVIDGELVFEVKSLS